MFVLDCSIATSWALSDERTDYTSEAFIYAEKNSAIVPYIFWYEVRNTMLVNQWRGRINNNDAMRYLADLQFIVRYDNAVNENMLFDIARQYRLSIYDAAYLELAKRMIIPLCSLDKKLLEAANSAGVYIWNV